jgi:tetratricopeptide (TPR) repeat protein
MAERCASQTGSTGKPGRDSSRDAPSSPSSATSLTSREWRVRRHWPHRGHFCMLVFRNQEAIGWCGRALRLLERFDDPGARVHAMINVGVARIQAGDDGGFAAVEDAILIGERAGLVDQVARAFFHCVQVTTAQRRHALTTTWFERGHAYCVEHEHESFRQFLLAFWARSLLNQGRWDEAEMVAEQVLTRAHSRDFWRLQALTVLGLLRARRGDAAAASYLDETDYYVTSTRADLSWSIGLMQARAEIAWQLGDPTRARIEAESAIERVRQVGESWGIAELSYWLSRSGGPTSRPEGADGPWGRQLAGAPEDAGAVWEAMGCPYEAAQALAESDAEPALRRALDTFEELGAKPAAARVRRRLRELGVRGVKLGPRPSTRDRPGRLTARELEVLRLLVEGLPNSAIARAPVRLPADRRSPGCIHPGQARRELQDSRGS